MSEAADGYNGPGQNEYFEFLGRQLEHRFYQMRYMAKQAANLKAWEAKGGDPKDIKDGMLLADMPHEERVAEANRQVRVFGWHGIGAQQEAGGQLSFAAALDAKPDATGAGNHPLGSLPSLGIVRIDGYQSGKRGSLNLADNPWPADTQESGVWAEAFGMGMEDRPPPKPSKRTEEAAAATEEGGEAANGAAPKKRGRKAKANGTEAAAPAAEAETAAPTEAVEADDARPGWQGDRDFTEEPPPPVQ